MSADHPKLETRTPKGQAFGARAESQLPERIDPSPLIGHGVPRARRSWARLALRIARDAAIAVALMTAIPVIIVARNGDRIWAPMEKAERMRSHAVNPEVFRAHAVTRDPSITPLEAGAAFSRLHPYRRFFNGFPDANVGPRADMTWMGTKLAPGMFPRARPVGFAAPSDGVIEAAVTGFNPAEMSYLRGIATAPAWREFDRVARAPAVDFLSARFRIPFQRTASLIEMPAPGYKITREMANAGLSRAAYHLALGQRDSAEAVLRSIVSFGFAMIDNATSSLDEISGTAIVNVGGTGLERFWRAVGDPRGNWRAAAPPAKILDLKRDPSTADIRAWLIARAADPATSRGDRFQALQDLSYSSCSNVREMLTGSRDDVAGAFRSARTSLARYPSERAVIDLAAQPPTAGELGPTSPIEYLTGSAGAVASAVLNNPRLASCSRIISWYRYIR